MGISIYCARSISFFAKHVGSIPALKNYAGLDAMGNPFFGAGQIYYMAI